MRADHGIFLCHVNLQVSPRILYHILSKTRSHGCTLCQVHFKCKWVHMRKVDYAIFRSSSVLYVYRHIQTNLNIYIFFEGLGAREPKDRGEGLEAMKNHTERITRNHKHSNLSLQKRTSNLFKQVFLIFSKSLRYHFNGHILWSVHL